MSLVILAAAIYTSLTLFAILFQFALVLGAPWGELAMSGKWKGKLPTSIRLSLIPQILLLISTVVIVWIHTGVIMQEYYNFSLKAIWFVIGLNTLAAILNTITPSKKERMLWAPITLMQLACSLIVAITALTKHLNS